MASINSPHLLYYPRRSSEVVLFSVKCFCLKPLLFLTYDYVDGHIVGVGAECYGKAITASTSLAAGQTTS